MAFIIIKQLKHIIVSLAKPKTPWFILYFKMLN